MIEENYKSKITSSALLGTQLLGLAVSLVIWFFWLVPTNDVLIGVLLLWSILLAAQGLFRTNSRIAIVTCVVAVALQGWLLLEGAAHVLSLLTALGLGVNLAVSCVLVIFKKGSISDKVSVVFAPFLAAFSVLVFFSSPSVAFARTALLVVIIYWFSYLRISKILKKHAVMSSE